MIGCESEFLAYTEEVAGSTPASPTNRIAGFGRCYPARRQGGVVSDNLRKEMHEGFHITAESIPDEPPHAPRVRPARTAE